MPKVVTTKGVMDSADLVIADIPQPWRDGDTVRVVATEYRLKALDDAGNVTNAGGELVRRDVWINVTLPQEMAATPGGM